MPTVAQRAFSCRAPGRRRADGCARPAGIRAHHRTARVHAGADPAARWAGSRGTSGRRTGPPDAQRAMPGPGGLEYSLIPSSAASRSAWTKPPTRPTRSPRRCMPPPAKCPGTLPPELQFVTLKPAAWVPTALKPAEFGEGIVVRFYNSHAAAVSGRVEFGLPVDAVTPVNLLEEPSSCRCAPRALPGWTCRASASGRCASTSARARFCFWPDEEHRDARRSACCRQASGAHSLATSSAFGVYPQSADGADRRWSAEVLEQAPGSELFC